MKYEDWIESLYMRYKYTREQLAQAAWDVATEKASEKAAKKHAAVCRRIAKEAGKAYSETGEPTERGRQGGAQECQQAILAR